MDRKQRKSTRRNIAVARLNESARALDSVLHRVGVPACDKEAFLTWALSALWVSYKEERMNKKIIIENEVRQLGIRFPNGTVKKEYSQSFNLPVDRIYDIQLLGAEELGLKLTAGEEVGQFTLKGRPVKVGDYILKLSFKSVKGEAPSVIPIPIAFNPNPRDLWRDIKTDPNDPYYKKDEECDYIKVETGADGIAKKDIVAASKRGRSHAQEGKPRDDHFKLLHCNESGWYIIAVADGAGSAKYSRKGSEIACQVAVEHCFDMLRDNPEFENLICAYYADSNKENRTNVTREVIGIVYKGASKAHQAIKNFALQKDDKLKDYATTLMFAICKQFDFGWFIASFWVGDGAMCIFDAENKAIKLLGTPDEGEFSGQTRFLTMPEIFLDQDVVSKRLRISIVPDFTALFLMTDGVSDPMFETDRNLNDYAKWEEFYNKLKTGFPEDEIGGVDLSDDNEAAKEQLLGWLDFWSPGNHDDRTIAILY